MKYYFRVEAENEFGVGEGRETETAVLAAEKPSVPVGLEAVDITSTSVTLAWKSPEQDGGSHIESYQLEAMAKGNDI